MQRDAPTKARDVVMNRVVNKPGMPRDFSKFLAFVSSWTRSRDVEQGRKWNEMDRKEFLAHWQDRGRNLKSAKAKWIKATNAKSFRKKRAFYEGKTTLDWVKQRRTVKDIDRVSHSLRCDQDPLQISGSQATSILGSALSLDGHSRTALGSGLFLIITIDSPSSLSPSPS